MRISDWSSDVCSSDLCRSGAHENLTLVPLSSLARDEGKPFQTIKDVGHRCLTQLEGRGNDAWRSFAATIYFLQHQQLRRRQPRGGVEPSPPQHVRPPSPPQALSRTDIVTPSRRERG